MGYEPRCEKTCLSCFLPGLTLTWLYTATQDDYRFEILDLRSTYEPRSEKTGLRGLQPGLTQTGMYSHRRWLEA